MAERHKTWPRGEYKGEDIECCSSCQMEDPKGYWETDRRPPYNMPEEDAYAYLCDVCYSTFASKPCLYPSLNHGGAVITTIAQCTNMILRELEGIHETLREIRKDKS